MIVQRTLTVIEPTYLMDGTFRDPFGAFYLTDLFGPNIFPSWVPQKFNICRARIGHQTANGLSGQLFVGIDKFRHCYRGGSLNPGYEEGDASRWQTLASLWLNSDMERSENYSPSLPFDRAVDSLWVRRSGGTGGLPDQMWWQIGIEADTANWPDYQPPTIVRWSDYLDAESYGWANYCVRIAIPESAIKGPFNLAALCLQASKTENLNISAAYLGYRASGSDFAAPPVLLKVNGQQAFTIPALRRQAFDDQPFAYTGGDLLLSFVVKDNGVTNRLPVKVGSAVTRYFKANGAADVATVAPTGFSTGANNNVALAWMATG